MGGATLVPTPPLLALEELPSHLRVAANVPASVIAIGSGKYIQLCRGARCSELEAPAKTNPREPLRILQDTHFRHILDSYAL